MERVKDNCNHLNENCVRNAEISFIGNLLNDFDYRSFWKRCTHAIFQSKVIKLMKSFQKLNGLFLLVIFWLYFILGTQTIFYNKLCKVQQVE